MDETNGRLKGLFLNTKKASCSIYESGVMMYKALQLSECYNLDYLEIDQEFCKVSNHYNFYVFNYHHGTMGWLNTKELSKQLTGLKITLVLEVAPNDPFVLCPKEDFDIYCALDPTLKVNDKRVYAFPRPLETFDNTELYQFPKIPIIGSFGFATIGKGFELVVDAVNKEFEEAVVKINIPSSTHADHISWNLHRVSYSEYLRNLCHKVAKSGIKVEITNDYMTKEELIRWCSQNTLNCFLYNRNQPGLSATTDQAIASGRPLAISNNPTFRHIHTYIKPYPYQTLKKSIELSQDQVLTIQKEWHPLNCATLFEQILKDNQTTLSKSIVPQSKLVQLQSLRSSNLFQTFKSKVKGKVQKTLKELAYRKGNNNYLPISKSMFVTHRFQDIDNELTKSKSSNPVVLIVSHTAKTCGIYQYGINITRALQKSLQYSFVYVECSNEQELEQSIIDKKPSIIVYNYYPAIMPWLTSQITRKYNILQLGFMHEVTQEEADKASTEMFDYHLCPDPTLIVNNSCIIKTPRLIAPYINSTFMPEIPTIGSFGFGIGDKGFEKLIETVQNEFDRAHIILHMPFNEVIDPEGRYHALNTAQRCREALKKPGISLAIHHDFLELHQLLDFLASNTLNVFFYDVNKDRGISSCIEHALAVQRPIAITKCGMFRHVFNTSPSICIEDSSLTEIIQNGVAPLVPFYNEWSEDNFILKYESIIDYLIPLKERKI